MEADRPAWKKYGISIFISLAVIVADGFDWTILDGVARLREVNLPSDVALKEALELSRGS